MVVSVPELNTTFGAALATLGCFSAERTAFRAFRSAKLGQSPHKFRPRRGRFGRVFCGKNVISCTPISGQGAILVVPAPEAPRFGHIFIDLSRGIVLYRGENQLFLAKTCKLRTHFGPAVAVLGTFSAERPAFRVPRIGHGILGPLVGRGPRHGVRAECRRPPQHL